MLLIHFCFSFIALWTEVISQQVKINHHKSVAFNGKFHEKCSVGQEQGWCMYQWQCFYSGGTAIGICSHGFQFGACCAYNSTSNELTPPSPPTTSTITTTSTTSSIPTKAKPTTKLPSDVILNPTPTVVEEAAKSRAVIDRHTRHACGVRARRPLRASGRIVNGTRSFVGEFPWQVSVMVYRGVREGFVHHCGGALLNERWVTTAAHCVTRILLIEMKVRVGEHDLSHHDDLYPHRDYKVKRKVVYPHYVSKNDYFDLTYENDIALLELLNPVKFKDYIAPICLPGSDDLLAARSSTVTGWGRRHENGTLTDILQKVNLPILANDECEHLYAKSGLKQRIPDIFLCAGFELGGSDACNGDSGGPLQTLSDDGRVILSGIVSWGNGCGEAYKPGVYTRVSKYVPWILENIMPSSN